MNSDKIRELIEKHFEMFLERKAKEEEIQHYLIKIREGSISINNLSKIFKSCEEFSRLQKKYEDIEKLDKDFEEILFQQNDNEEIIEDKIEAWNIFVSAYNEDTKKGGIFVVKEQKLVPIFTDKICIGLCFYKPKQILFGITENEPQLIAFKINENDFQKIPIIFENYILARDPHGICIKNDKIFVVASNGDEYSKKATHTRKPKGYYNKDGDFVGKIIASELDFNETIHIKNSKVFDPFRCTHHHHINDICFHNEEMFMTSLSYCDENKKYVEKGALSKLDTEFNAKIINNKLRTPHSLQSYKNKLYFCSSSQAALLSMNENEKLKLEYKGIDAFMRGVLITNDFFYIGYSTSLQRTNSKFVNPLYGILKINKKSGESIKIDLPQEYNNVYSIM